MEIRVWMFQNYRDCRYTCNPHDDYMHVTGNTLWHRDSLHFLWGKHLQWVQKWQMRHHKGFGSIVGRFGLVYLHTFTPLKIPRITILVYQSSSSDDLVNKKKDYHIIFGSLFKARFVEPGWSLPWSRRMRYNVKGYPRTLVKIDSNTTFNLADFQPF